MNKYDMASIEEELNCPASEIEDMEARDIWEVERNDLIEQYSSASGKSWVEVEEIIDEYGIKAIQEALDFLKEI